MVFYKRYKKLFSMLVVFVMLFQVLGSAEGFYTSAEEGIIKDGGNFTPLSGEVKDLGNIFTLGSFRINGVEAVENQVAEIIDGTKVELRYLWNTEGKDAKPGDYAQITIPDAFKTAGDFSGIDIIVEGSVVGKYSIIDNVLKFVFDEGIINVGDVSNGYVGFGAKFSEEKFQEDVVEKIEFKDFAEKTITVIGKPTQVVKSIAKKGTPDSSSDAKFITWEIDITNPSGEKITNAILKDTLPEGLDFDHSSVEVRNLNVKLDGTLTLVSDDKVNIEPVILDKDISFEFDSIDPYKGYRVTYRTEITDLAEIKFTNNASLEFEEKKLSASGTVSGLTRSDFIEKEGKQTDGNADQIEWVIDVNKNGGIINEAIIEDLLPTGNALVEGSIEIFKLTKSGDTWKEISSDKIASNFPVNLGKLGSTDAYRIKFKTSVDYSNVNKGEYSKENTFKNETTLKDGKQLIGEAEKIVTTTRKPILEKAGNALVNYTNKKINWKVTVNAANHTINNAVITDTLPEGLTLTASDIVVKNSKGKPVTADVTVTVSEGSPKIVTVAFGNIKENFTIEYTTTITNFTINTFINSVVLGGSGVGTGGNKITVPVQPPNNSYGKTFVDIDYKEKTMSWNITVKPTREAISKLIIKDTFPNKGLILLKDTLEVKIGTVTQLLGTNYTLDAIDGSYSNGFILDFSKVVSTTNPLNEAVSITYKTSFDPEKGIIKNSNEERTYINNAHFTGKTKNGNTIDLYREAKHIVKIESWNSGKKLGKLISVKDNTTSNGWVSGKERKIQWEVYINYLNQSLGTGVSVSDVLGYDGEIDTDSIVVKKYEVAKDGTTTLGTTIAEEDYSIKFDNNDTKAFTLTFNKAVSERYAIVFTSSVPKISEKTYTNIGTVKFGNVEHKHEGSVGFNDAGKDLSKKSINTSDKVYTDDEVNWIIQINKSLSTIEADIEIVDTISKGLVYKQGSLKVYKLDGPQRTEFTGYEHEVSINDKSETVLTIKFGNEINSTYEIEYTTVVTAIDGEVNNSVSYSGNNLESKTLKTTSLKAEQFSYVGGDPSKGKIIIQKVDNKGELITAQTEFEVYYYLNDVEYLVNGKTYTTVNGIMEIGNLRLNRTYYIREKTAPYGFIKDEKVMEIEVNRSTGVQDIGAYTSNYVNNHIQTTAIGTKTWVNGPKNNRPDIQLQLFRNGIKLGGPETIESPTTEHTWVNIDLTDNAGVEYTYTIKEVDTPENYAVTYDGLNVTNEYVIPKTSVTAFKEWVNGPEIKPTIKLQLYRDGVAFEEPKEIIHGQSEVVWDDLDKTDINGETYTYTVEEVEVPENYEVSYDGLSVTNEYISPLTSVTGRKQWVNGPVSDRPDVQLQLYRNGSKFEEPITLMSGEFEYTWSELDLTDEKASAYKYTVDEVSVPENYGKTRLDDLTIVNTYNSPTTDITGRKVWKGGPNEKPTVELQLYRDGVAFEKPKEIIHGEFEAVWVGLDITDINGKTYTYTVKEVEVPENYEVVEDGLTVTNTYKSPKTEFTVNKVWVDGPSERPTIELQLFRNGEVFGDTVALVNKQLEYTWRDLDLTDNNAVEYEYTVKEVSVPKDYTSTISEDGLTITNTYVIPKIEVVGSKVWYGGPANKPTIQLQLYRDGEIFGEPITLEDGELEYTWTNLDKSDIDGSMYKFTIEEVEVPEQYDMSISDDGLTVYNTYYDQLSATPPTGISNNYMLFAFILLFSSISLIILTPKRKTRKN